MFIHVVKANETLWRIAGLYNVPIDAIVNVNELPNPETLVIGQALVIPKEAMYHTVQPGESPWSIAQQYGVSVQSLVAVNGIQNPNLIYPGTILAIPQKPRPVIQVNGYICSGTGSRNLQ